MGFLCNFYRIPLCECGLCVFYGAPKRFLCNLNWFLPVVPHKAVAEVSKIGNLSELSEVVVNV